MKTIAIYGGSFDPIHTGHAMVANYVSQLPDIDEVWLMVSKRNPMKENAMASDLERLEMAALVAEKCNNVKVSDFEMGLPSPSFTYHTLLKLKEAFPDYNFKIIIGADNWIDFGQWKNHDKILSEFGVIVFDRPGFTVASKGNQDGIIFLRDTPQCHISSTLVREMARQGKNINFLVPENVADYITKNNLYKKDGHK